MNLTTAISLVVADTREITMADVLGSRGPGDDPQLVPAYRTVLQASDEDIAAALLAE